MLGLCCALLFRALYWSHWVVPSSASNWLSAAELGLASVALTKMFSVPAPHSVVLYSSPAKAAHCCRPLCSRGFIVLQNKLIYFPGLKSGMDVFLGLLQSVRKKGSPA